MAEDEREKNDLPDLLTVKRAAKREFGQIAGIEGFGIGNHKLRIYVSNEALCKELPKKFHGVEVDFIVVEDVVAAK
jgi:hypothetical protein